MERNVIHKAKKKTSRTVNIVMRITHCSYTLGPSGNPWHTFVDFQTPVFKARRGLPGDRRLSFLWSSFAVLYVGRTSPVKLELGFSHVHSKSNCSRKAQKL